MGDTKEPWLRDGDDDVAWATNEIARHLRPLTADEQRLVLAAVCERLGLDPGALHGGQRADGEATA